MTRNGKIARLSRNVREELNRRLRDGEQGKRLVEWLNALPKVQEVLAEEFGGRPISEQNLSEWKQGGFEDWLRHQETREWVRKLADESADLKEIAGDLSVADRLAPRLAVLLGRWIQELAAGEQNDPAQRKALLAIAREVAELRRSDHEEERLRINRERRDAEAERQFEEQRQREIYRMKDKACAPIWARLEMGAFAGAFGGGEAGEKAAAFITEIEYDLPRGTLSRKSSTDQTGSNPIQPNQANADKTQ
jgi:hypothetical protein